MRASCRRGADGRMRTTISLDARGGIEPVVLGRTARATSGTATRALYDSRCPDWVRVRAAPRVARYGLWAKFSYYGWIWHGPRAEGQGPTDLGTQHTIGTWD